MSRVCTYLQPALVLVHPKRMVLLHVCAACLALAGVLAIQASGQTTATPALPDVQRSSPASQGGQGSSAPSAVKDSGASTAGARGRAKPGTVRGGSRNPAPAAAKTEKVEVIGQQNGRLSATIDKPLLPIASLGDNLGIRSGTPIQVRFNETVDSGHAHNGDTIQVSLAQPLVNFPVGTPVKLTVVQASPAGALLSFGELSLQVISIGGHPVLSDTISAQGVEGKKDLPDSAPARGTEAIFHAGQVIALPAA